MTKDKSSGELVTFRALYHFFFITICLAVDSVPKCYITEGNFKK